MEISEFACDDEFESAWVANALAEGDPHLEIFLDKEEPFNQIVMTEEKVRRFPATASTAAAMENGTS